MVEIGLGKLNKDGGVTIPYGMRKHLKPGETLVFLADEKPIKIKRLGDVSASLRQMAGEPSTASGVHKTARAPIHVPKRDKFGHFLPGKKKK